MWLVNILNANSDSWCPVCSAGYWHSQTISTNVTHDCMIQKGIYPFKTKKQSPHNCFWIVYYIRVASPIQTSENVVGKIGRAQTCNEYISWLAETYLNIISNELRYTLYILLPGIALKIDELPAKQIKPFPPSTS